MEPNPLTVVICYDYASVNGGQAKVAIDSAVGLKRAGHRPIYFAATGPVSGELVAAGVETVCLEQSDLNTNASRMAAMIQGTWNGPAATRLASLLEGLPRGRTIVHVHGWAKALSPSIAGPIIRSGLPAAYTLHEYFQFCPNGGFYNYPQQKICKLRPLSAACWGSNCDARNYGRKLWRNARLQAARSLFRLPEAFTDYVAISEFQRGIVAPLVPAAARLHRIANPVSVSDPGPKADAASGEVIFVGRLSWEKGAPIFAEAARRAGITPTFIGDGPLASQLRRDYPEARFLGWLAPDRVSHALRAARALAFPSVWYEGQPLTVLEAKAMGTPVVVSDACAGREEVIDGVTGLWFTSGDVDHLAQALRATQDAARISAMSNAAHAAYWADPPTPERHVERIVGLYRGMIERVAGSAGPAERHGIPTAGPARMG